MSSGHVYEKDIFSYVIICPKIPYSWTRFCYRGMVWTWKRGQTVDKEIDGKKAKECRFASEYPQTGPQVNPYAGILLFQGRGVFCDHLHERPEMSVRQYREPGNCVERRRADGGQMVDRCFDSKDYAEGRRTFMEKRESMFTGKWALSFLAWVWLFL